MDIFLTVRNLTPKSIWFESATRSQLPSKHPALKGTANATEHLRSDLKNLHLGVLSNGKAHASESDADPETKVQSWFEPSKVVKTHLHAPKLPLEILEIKLVIDDCELQVKLPEASVRCLSRPDNAYLNPYITFLYSASDGFLALCYSRDLPRWMSRFKDDTPLPALSIPGTHNSPAYHKALPSVRCQAASVAEQLLRGVRFFDIRLQVRPADIDPRRRLVLVHSAFSVKLVGHNTLHDLLDDIARFLEVHPSETILMSVKRDSGKGTDEQLGTLLHDLYASDHSKWFTAPRPPYLGEARGKIVLIRRFNLGEDLKHEYGGAGWGIDASVWADNTPESTCPSGHVCVQDYYSMMTSQDVDKKIHYSQGLLAKAAKRECDPRSGGHAADEKHPLIINFLTGSNLWKLSCWPERIAARLNPHILDYLCKQHSAEPEKVGDGGTGIVVCDWVGHNGNWDLITCIVAMNSR